MKKWKLPVLLAVAALLVIGAAGYGIYTWLEEDGKPQSVASGADVDKDSDKSSDAKKQATGNEDEADDKKDSSSKKKTEGSELPVYKEEKKENQDGGNQAESNDTKPSETTPDETEPDETEPSKDDSGVIELPMVPVN